MDDNTELSETEMALMSMEYGLYDIVEHYQNAKLEKERLELEQRKKELGLDNEGTQ